MYPRTSIESMHALRDAAAVVLPSLLQCDFGNLQREIERLEEAGIKALHLDVMDGHFVPNLSYGMPLVAARWSMKKEISSGISSRRSASDGTRTGTTESR